MFKHQSSTSAFSLSLALRPMLLMLALMPALVLHPELALSAALSPAQGQKLTQETIMETILKNIETEYDLKASTTTNEKKQAKVEQVEVEVETKKDKLGESALTANENTNKKILENRLQLQKQQGLGSDKILTAKEKIELMKAKVREDIAAQKTAKAQAEAAADAGQEKDLKQKGMGEKGDDNWMAKAKGDVQNWMTDSKTKEQEWLQAKKKLVADWLQDRERFKKLIPEYQEKALNPPTSELNEKEKALIDDLLKNRFVVTKEKKLVSKVSYTTQRETVVKRPLSTTYIIKNAFIAPVKDQKLRATCSSFAAIRALEILSSQQTGTYTELSEQYFYWASKPECQRSPCSGSRGSAALIGLQASINSSGPDIPREADCPYQENDGEGNETQTPLASGCHKGFLKVTGVDTIPFEDADKMVNALNLDYPIVAGMELSPQFYDNNGFVFLHNKKTPAATNAMDNHSAGHAMLFVGYIQLPDSLWESEGRYCFLTANSWGTGWGVGGHSCLGHKWILDHMKGRNSKYYWGPTGVSKPRA